MTAIIERWLPYVERLDARPAEAIRRVVVHATELPDLATAREYGEYIHYPDSGTGNSGHFYIDRDGTVEQWVPLTRVAHHVRGHNADSIGVELVSLGRWPDWYHSRRQQWREPPGEPQIEALIDLVRDLRSRLPALAAITGHDRLDTREVPASDDPGRTVRRKLDPGPQFPWSRVVGATGLALADAADGRD